MNAVWHEIRQALAKLRHSPGFTLLAVLILGLGLGATVFMFAVVKAYMLTPLPFPEAERIMYIENRNVLDGDDEGVTQREFVEWRKVQESFAAIAGFYIGTVNLSDGELPERFAGAFMTPSGFDVIRQDAYLGRVFTAADAAPGATPVIVLGYEAWLNRYNGDPGIIGQTVRVNGSATTVIGVMPEGFRFPTTQEAWLPLKIDPADLARGDLITLQTFGRLKPDVSLQEARAEFANITAALAERYVEYENLTTTIKPYQHEYTGPEARQTISVMFIAVVFVLLIACVNVANLILARTAARQKDIALRAALGASRWRILVHVLTESIVLAVAGTAIAWLLADAGLDLTNRAFIAANVEEPFWVDTRFDRGVLLFAMLAAIVTGVLAGLVPALRATRVDVNEHLKEGSKGSGASASRLSRTLVTAQIALSCILLVCSGLLIRSIVNMNAMPLGIENTELLTGRIGLPEAQYGDGETQLRFFEQLAERLQAHPGVQGATVGYSYPGIDSNDHDYRTRDMVASPDAPLPYGNFAGVLNNYAKVLGIPVLQGRWFDTRDHAGSTPVVVLDQRLATEAFSGENPLGQQIAFDEPGYDAPHWRTVVGVVDNVLLDEVGDPVRGAAFVPLAQAPRRFLTVAVDTHGEPRAFSQALRETVQSIDPDIPVYWMRTLDDWLWMGNFTGRVVSTLFSVFAFIAVVLAAAGIYGVLAYSVNQRTREIGVRRALGAVDGRILSMVLGQGMLQLGIGLGIGLLCAVGFARLLSSELYGVSPFDLATLAAVTLVLFAVALVASLLPALRAMRVNPMEALRYE